MKKWISYIIRLGNKLKVKVLIPCICKECRTTSTPHYYDKASLDKRKDKGIDEIQCDHSYDKVNVKDLLDGVIENAGNSSKPDEKSSAVKKRIFISYSRHDTEQKDTLLKHLQGLRDLTVTWMIGTYCPERTGMTAFGMPWKRLILCCICIAQQYSYSLYPECKTSFGRGSVQSRQMCVDTCNN
jgi:hypothetical protein